MVARGGFVEDKLSPVLKRTVERLGLKEGHSRFGCYLLDDHAGVPFTGHLDGGSYITQAQRDELLATGAPRRGGTDQNVSPKDEFASQRDALMAAGAPGRGGMDQNVS